MKTNLIKISITIILCLVINPLSTYAHPGRTDIYGCHTCRTNCEKYGLRYNEYHCHNGGASYYPSSNETTKKIKSSDNRIKNIKINNKELILTDEMAYKTKAETLDIDIVLNDKNATYEINKKDLQIGENIIEIKVTAENGSIKTYKLNVTREALSNNTNLKVLINNYEINFNDEINVPLETQDLVYRYVLEDENAKLEVTGDKDLKEGKNIVKFLVTAEDGTQKEYHLVIDKSDKIINNNEAWTSIITTAVVIGGIYYYIKKHKN